MGPRSTAPFVDMVVDECQRQYGARDDLDFPPMLIYSLPTPFYIDRPIDHVAMQAVIGAGLRKLADDVLNLSWLSKEHLFRGREAPDDRERDPDTSAGAAGDTSEREGT